MRPHLTKNRKMLLGCLNESSSPLSALDLYQLLHDHLNLATVYRGLLYLESINAVGSLTISCREEGAVRYYFVMKEPHDHFFHCESCHKFIPIAGCGLSSMTQEVEAAGHQVNSHFLYFTGLCAACRQSP